MTDPGTRPPDLLASHQPAPVAPGDPAVAGSDPATGQTGHPRVDAALEALADSAGLPPAEQIAVYDEVHRTLQETLTSIDEGRS